MDLEVDGGIKAKSLEGQCKKALMIIKNSLSKKR